MTRDDSDLEISVHRKAHLDPGVVYIGKCCREWPMAFGYPPGRCGYCGDAPEFLRWDDKR
jgi:hypothetical protein